MLIVTTVRTGLETVYCRVFAYDCQDTECVLKALIREKQVKRNSRSILYTSLKFEIYGQNEYTRSRKMVIRRVR